MEGPFNISTDTYAARRKKPFFVLAGGVGLICLFLIFSEGLYNVSFGKTPLIVLGLMVWVLTFIDPRVGLGLMIFTIAMSPEFVIFGVPNIRLEDFVFPAILIAWLSRALFLREKLVPNNLALPILLLILISLVSSMHNIIYSSQGSLTTLFRFVKGIEYYLMFFVTLNILKTRKELSLFIQILWIAAACTTIYSLLYLQANPLTTHGRFHGVPGETANIFGGFLIFHICIILGIASVKPKFKLPALLIVIAMAVPFVQTLSRSSYVALFFGLLVLALLTREKNVLIFLLIALTLMVLTQARDRFETIFGVFSGDPPSSWVARVAGWKEFLPRMLNAPLVGRGLGSSTLAIDNEYVRQIYELGLLGFFLFVWLVVRAAKTAFRIHKGGADTLFSGFSRGYLAGLTALLVHSIAATTFTTIRTTEPFFISTAILYGIVVFMPQETNNKAEELPRQLNIARPEGGDRTSSL